MRKDALIQMAQKFGWDESISSKPLKKMIKDDFIEYIMQMVEIFKNDQQPVDEEPTEFIPASLPASLAEEFVIVQDAPSQTPDSWAIQESITKNEEANKECPQLEDSFNELAIEPKPENTLIKSFSTMSVGAIPKKRPPPLNIPLVHSINVEHRPLKFQSDLPQLVESVLPIEKSSSVFFFPEKSETISENGTRLRNAKELSDVLVEIKNFNNCGLASLGEIDSLLNRAFGVSS